MKKINILITLIVGFFVSTSCTDFVDPAIPYSGFETGTYLKTIKVPSSINFFDLDNALFSTLVECHAVDKINNVNKVEVFVKHRRGNTVSNEQLLGTVPGSSFTTTADSKWPRATVSFKVSEAMAKLGFTKATLKGGDFIEYRFLLTTLDNKVFTSTNGTGDVFTGEYFNSPFLYRVAIVCPSTLAGTYTYTATGTSTDDCCLGPATTTTGTVTLTANAATGSYKISDVTGGLYFKWYGVYGITAADARLSGNILDACGGISGSFPEPFQTSFTVTGTADPVSGIIKYSWKNGYDDKGDVVLTPKK